MLNNWKTTSLVAADFISLLISDFLYFKNIRNRLDGGSISESFIRKGSLGKILKNNGFLALSQETANTAANDMCAKDDDLTGFDYHDSVRLRLFIIVKEPSTFTARILSKNSASQFKQLLHEQDVKVNPRQYYYSINFRTPINSPISLELTSESVTGVNIGHIYIDGQLNKTHDIAYRSQIVNGTLFRQEKTNNTSDDIAEIRRWQKRLQIGKFIPKLTIQLNNGLPKDFFNGAFPGKKRQGHCRYVANLRHRSENKYQQISDMPLVKLYVDENQWSGQHGILNNRVRAHGRAWEIPAKVKVFNQDQYLEQSVGLRFHGGIPARSARKYAHNYRIYARGEYGKNTLNSHIFNGHDRGLDFKTIVFKNTYHANFFEEFTDFNPFTHALAFDVANQVNAIIPDHFMVDLYVNDKQQPPFLGIEHLSERTIKNWLGHSDFELFIYRNENTKKQKDIIKHIIASVRSKKGEDALLELQKFYDIDNVMNSIILNAYVANHDFCQGAEIFANVDSEPDDVRVTSINWDLDHSFMQVNDGVWSIRGDHILFPMLNKRYKDNNNRDCERTLIYGWVYEQSSNFRTQFKKRLNELLTNELSFEEMNTVLNKYRNINQDYYKDRHNQAIDDLKNYISRRPSELRKDIQVLEDRLKAQ